MNESNLIKGDPFWNVEDMLNIIDCFEKKGQMHHQLTFTLGLLLGRRISDTLSFEWSHFYYKNGQIKREIEGLKEMKTKKSTKPYISSYTKEVLQSYVEKMDIKPTDFLDEFVFPSQLKTEWRGHRNHCIYDGNTKYPGDKANGIPENIRRKIATWYTFLTRQVSEKTIEDAFKRWGSKLNINKSLEDFLYQEEFVLAIKSQAAAYRKALNKVTEEVGINYRTGTHSTRRSFGYWTVKLHPNDNSIIYTVQQMLAHSDIQTTLAYTGLSREKEIGCYEEIGNFLKESKAGNKPVIKNSPVISLKSEDLRELFEMAYAAGKEDGDKYDILNKIYGLSEELMVH